MLLWTVLNLVSNIEITFNRIWQVKKGRSMYRKITDYFSMFLLMPILIVVSGGLSIFVGTMLKSMADFVLLAPILKFLIRLIPFVLTWLMFTGLYIFMPNTKVKFKHALISGILAGSAYQAFQFLYISSQLWVSKYNAIYGSFSRSPDVLVMVADIMDHLPVRCRADVCRPEHPQLQFRQRYAEHQSPLPRFHIYLNHVSYSQTFRKQRNAFTPPKRYPKNIASRFG